MARGTYTGSDLVDRIRRATTALEMALMPETGHELTPEAIQAAWDSANELTHVVALLPNVIASALAFGSEA